MTRIPPLAELKKSYFDGRLGREGLFTLLMYNVRNNAIAEIVGGLGKDLEHEFREHVMAFAPAKSDDDIMVCNGPRPKLTLNEVRQFIDYYRSHELLP